MTLFEFLKAAKSKLKSLMMSLIVFHGNVRCKTVFYGTVLGRKFNSSKWSYNKVRDVILLNSKDVDIHKQFDFDEYFKKIAKKIEKKISKLGYIATLDISEMILFHRYADD